MAILATAPHEVLFLRSQAAKDSLRKTNTSNKINSQNILGLKTGRRLKFVTQCRLQEDLEMESSPLISPGLRMNSNSFRVSASSSSRSFMSVTGARPPRGDEMPQESALILNQSVPLSGDEGRDLVQALHDAAQEFVVALEDQQFEMKGSWFGQKLFGYDEKAWMRLLAHQAVVHSLLSAVLEIASRGQGRGRDIPVFVQRSLLRQLSPLEESIKQNLSIKDSAADDWFWTQHHHHGVANFVRLLEEDSRFVAVTTTELLGHTLTPNQTSDEALLALSVSISGALKSLGSDYVSCPSFLSTLSEELSPLMDMLGETVHINEVYQLTLGAGLEGDFLNHFGSRAADLQNANKDEVTFWVELVEKVLSQALVREGVCAKLVSQENVEANQRDLAIFGFFAALGRTTRGFLSVQHVGDCNDSIASLLRYLEGGSALFYRQLVTLPTYQLFIEVVSEELEWLPFYPDPSEGSNEENKKIMQQGEKLFAIKLALATCSAWMDRFTNYHLWAQRPLSLRTRRFLATSMSRLKEGEKVSNIANTALDGSLVEQVGVEEKLGHKKLAAEIPGPYRVMDLLRQFTFPEMRKEGMDDDKDVQLPYRLASASSGSQDAEGQLKSFNKELQGVEEAIQKLEDLVEDSKRLGLPSGRQRLIVTQVDLEKIRKLKHEVEELEATLEVRAKERGPSMKLVQDKKRGQMSPLSEGVMTFWEGAKKIAQGLKTISWPVLAADNPANTNEQFNSAEAAYLNEMGSEEVANITVSSETRGEISAAYGDLLSKSIDKFKHVGAVGQIIFLTFHNPVVSTETLFPVMRNTWKDLRGYSSQSKNWHL